MVGRYQRKTHYRPYAERQFSIRPVFRDPPDLEKLAAANMRYALVRSVAHAGRAARRG
jgi:hypothetical protein